MPLFDEDSGATGVKFGSDDRTMLLPDGDVDVPRPDTWLVPIIPDNKFPMFNEGERSVLVTPPEIATPACAPVVIA